MLVAKIVIGYFLLSEKHTISENTFTILNIIYSSLLMSFFVLLKYVDKKYKYDKKYQWKAKKIIIIDLQQKPIKT